MDESEQEIKRRKAREQRAASKARRAAADQKWRDQVDAHFHFLQTEYGYQIVKVDSRATGGWESIVIYQSERAAVRVSNNLEYDRAEVSLIRLVDGAIPPYPIFFFQDSTLDQTLLENVVLRRAPELRTRYSSMKGRSDEQLDATLAFLAEVARGYASDVLSGDFSIFEEIQAERREYARKHPPKITVYGSASGSADQLAQLAEETQQSNPGVEVEVRTYIPPTSGGKASGAQDKGQDADDRPPFGFHASRPK